MRAKVVKNIFAITHVYRKIRLKWCSRGKQRRIDRPLRDFYNRTNDGNEWIWRRRLGHHISSTDLLTAMQKPRENHCINLLGNNNKIKKVE